MSDARFLARTQDESSTILVLKILSSDNPLEGLKLIMSCDAFLALGCVTGASEATNRILEYSANACLWL